MVDGNCYIKERRDIIRRLHMSEIIKKLEQEQLKENAPKFNVGDTVKV